MIGNGNLQGCMQGSGCYFHAFNVKLYLTGLGMHNKEQYL